MTQSSKKVQKMPQYTEFFYTNYAKLSKNHCNTREKLLLSLFYRNFAPQNDASSQIFLNITAEVAMATRQELPL